ncbi:hypothetical protein DOK76_12945, partial [Vagococcus sp. DIV0080]|nr:hypothetical protein [Vagococcus sp. DIV0080]
VPEKPAIHKKQKVEEKGSVKTTPEAPSTPVVTTVPKAETKPEVTTTPGVKEQPIITTVPKVESKPTIEKASEAKIGTDFGKMGTLVEKNNIKINWSEYAEHGMQRLQERGMSQIQVDEIVRNGKVLSQNDGAKFAYVTQEGVAVVSKEGKLVTAWGKNNFDDSMNKIIIGLFGK